MKVWLSGVVVLTLYPEASMIWREWAEAIRGLEWYIGQYEAVDVLFTVGVEGKGSTVASGNFVTLAGNTGANTSVKIPVTTPSYLGPVQGKVQSNRLL